MPFATLQQALTNIVDINSVDMVRIARFVARLFQLLCCTAWLVVF